MFEAIGETNVVNSELVVTMILDRVDVFQMVDLELVL